MVTQRGGKFIFTEPGYTRFDGVTNRVIETVEPQEFTHDTEAEALDHARWYLNPPREWFPPPPA